MVLQKRKHPKYRRSKNEFEKEQLKRAIKLKERQSLKESLYKLPKDLKILIYQMVVQSHMNEWSFNHMRNLRNSLLFISEKKETLNSVWFILDNDELKYYSKSLCSRNIDKRDKLGIVNIIIYNNMYEDIDIREYSNSPNTYWYHYKCRCKQCDKVRIVGMQNLSSYHKMKFGNIEWPVWSDQWIAKSSSQIRHDINMNRNIKRRSQSSV